MTARQYLMFLIVLCLLLVGAPALPANAALNRSNEKFLTDCAKLPQRVPRVHIQKSPGTDVTGGIAGIPGRVITDVQPGERTERCIGFQNRTGGLVTFQFSALDVGIGRSGAPTGVSAEDARHGAATWITLPPQRVTVAHGEIAWVRAGIDVPIDTSGGSSYAEVVAEPVKASESGSQTKITPSVAVQLFLDVPGDFVSGGEITEVRSPRVIWWDGLDLGRFPVLDDLRGQGIAPIRFKWRNKGSLTDSVSGGVAFESSLGGREVEDLPISPLVVLRDSSRPFEVTWSRDIPLVGRFTPTVRIATSDGRTITQKLPAIWVIPSWWYLLLLTLAISLPLALRRRSKRRYRELEARVASAENRVETSDSEWDDDDGWSDQPQ